MWRLLASPRSAISTTRGDATKQVVGGFFAYHAVPTNARALGAFRHHVMNLWRRTLLRRSRLSVQPVEETYWNAILQVAESG